MIATREAIEAIVVTAGGIFFAYRFFTGWMSANVDIAIEPSRVHLNEEQDYLAVIVKLERGEYGPVQLGDAQIRITYLDPTIGSPAPLNLVGTERLFNSAGKVDWQKVEPESPHLSLHAKEKSVFSAALTVPRKTACVIEVAFSTHRRLDGLIRFWLGRKRWGQRRSSSVSLPLSDHAVPLT